MTLGTGNAPAESSTVLTVVDTVVLGIAEGGAIGGCHTIVGVVAVGAVHELPAVGFAFHCVERSSSSCIWLHYLGYYPVYRLKIKPIAIGKALVVSREIPMESVGGRQTCALRKEFHRRLSLRPVYVTVAPLDRSENYAGI